MKITPTRARWLGRIGAAFLRTYAATWRFRTIGTPLPEDRGSFIFAFLHGEMLMASYKHRGCGAAILTSMHGDGEVMAQVVTRLGYLPVRGSSTRGGVRGLLELARAHQDRILAITPDGPKGPYGSVHEGVVTLAALTRRTIIPASYASARYRRLASWDRFTIPKAGTKVVEYLGEPITIPRDIGPSERTEWARELERRFVSGSAIAQGALSGSEATAAPAR